MYCPLLIHDEESCLLDNCRYYDSEHQECIYAGTSGTKKEPAHEKPQIPVPILKPEKTSVSEVKEEDLF